MASNSLFASCRLESPFFPPSATAHCCRGEVLPLRRGSPTRQQLPSPSHTFFSLHVSPENSCLCLSLLTHTHNTTHTLVSRFSSLISLVSLSVQVAALSSRALAWASAHPSARPAPALEQRLATEAATLRASLFAPQVARERVTSVH